MRVTTCPGVPVECRKNVVALDRLWWHSIVERTAWSHMLWRQRPESLQLQCRVARFWTMQLLPQGLKCMTRSTAWCLLTCLRGCSWIVACDSSHWQTVSSWRWDGAPHRQSPGPGRGGWTWCGGSFMQRVVLAHILSCLYQNFHQHCCYAGCRTAAACKLGQQQISTEWADQCRRHSNGLNTI